MMRKLHQRPGLCMYMVRKVAYIYVTACKTGILKEMGRRINGRGGAGYPLLSNIFSFQRHSITCDMW
jgi:hypothetical protein